jgi:hypothetical protein
MGGILGDVLNRPGESGRDDPLRFDEPGYNDMDRLEPDDDFVASDMDDSGVL